MNPRTEQSDLPYRKNSRIKMVIAAIAAMTLFGASLPGNAKDRDDKLLTCDDTMKEEFRPDSLTTVLLVKAFKQGRCAHAFNADPHNTCRSQ